MALAVESGQPIDALKGCTMSELDALRRVLDAKKANAVQARQHAEAMHQSRKMAGRA